MRQEEMTVNRCHCEHSGPTVEGWRRHNVLSKDDVYDKVHEEGESISMQLNRQCSCDKIKLRRVVVTPVQRSQRSDHLNRSYRVLYNACALDLCDIYENRWSVARSFR